MSYLRFLAGGLLAAFFFFGLLLGGLPVDIAARTAVSKSSGESVSGRLMGLTALGLSVNPSINLDFLLALCLIMTNLAIKDLLRTREQIASRLRQNSPDFAAVEALDRLISSLKGETKDREEREEEDAVKSERADSAETNADFLVQAITQKGAPMSSSLLGRRLIKAGRTKLTLVDDAAANVSSTLSRDERVESITWKGGRRWWIKGKEIPPEP